MTARFTYQHLLALVDGDQELIAHLVDEGIIEQRGDTDAVVDVDDVLVARTLWRDLEIEWPAIDVILRIRAQLVEARRKIAELEETLASRG